MRWAVTILPLILVVCPSLAQEMETLMTPGVSNGGFGAVVTRVTSIKDEFGVIAGIRGAWITNHTFSMGAGFYGMATQNVAMNGSEVGGIAGHDYLLEMGYAGLEFEYVYPWHKLIHMNAHVLVGGGGVAYVEDPQRDHGEDDLLDSDAFFIVEPAICLELNVASPMRLDVGLSYRFVSNIELPQIDNRDIDGPAATLTLKFGGF
jgi:hypothetical protein